MAAPHVAGVAALIIGENGGEEDDKDGIKNRAVDQPDARFPPHTDTDRHKHERHQDDGSPDHPFSRII